MNHKFCPNCGSSEKTHFLSWNGIILKSWCRECGTLVYNGEQWVCNLREKNEKINEGSFSYTT